MERVGRHLQIEAKKNIDIQSKDVFGRAAYNRYYYAIFLSIRELLQTIDERWSETPHAAYPDILSKNITKKFQTAKRIAQKVGDTELMNACSKSEHALKELARIMTLGSTTRVVADYRPDVKIVFDDDQRFSLQGVGINTAEQWYEQSKLFKRIILSTWEQINE